MFCSLSLFRWHAATAQIVQYVDRTSPQAASDRIVLLNTLLRSHDAWADRRRNGAMSAFGARGRGFKSLHPDQEKGPLKAGFVL